MLLQNITNMFFDTFVNMAIKARTSWLLKKIFPIDRLYPIPITFMVITFYQDSTKLYDDGMAAFSLIKSCYMRLLIRKNFSKPRWSSNCVSLSILSRVASQPDFNHCICKLYESRVSKRLLTRLGPEAQSST